MLHPFLLVIAVAVGLFIIMLGMQTLKRLKITYERLANPADLSPDTRTVLVIDDDPMRRTLHRLMLVRAGYAVFEAEDGLDGLSQAVRRIPDFLLIAETLRGLDSAAVVAALSHNPLTQHIPVTIYRT